MTHQCHLDHICSLRPMLCVLSCALFFTLMLVNLLRHLHNMFLKTEAAEQARLACILLAGFGAGEPCKVGQPPSLF